MTVTFTLDDDVVAAALELASAEQRSLNEMISVLVRRALDPAVPGRERNGIPLLERRNQSILMTSELVKRLDQEIP